MALAKNRDRESDRSAASAASRAERTAAVGLTRTRYRGVAGGGKQVLLLIVLGALLIVLIAAGCKKTSPSSVEDGGFAVPEPKGLPLARFVSIAELRRNATYRDFAAFVLTDDDIEESSSSAPPARGEDEDDELSPDRPPSDITIARLALTGEVYTLSYEENCGEGLEDQRNLHYVLIERKAKGLQKALQEVLRVPLCGDDGRGITFELLDLDADRRPELVVRTWVVDPERASEHGIRVLRATPTGLVELSRLQEAHDGAEQFEVVYPRVRGRTLIEVRVRYPAADGGAARQVARRYELKGKKGLVLATSSR
jgi:hypothetical protein